MYYNSNTKFKLLGMYTATEFRVGSSHNKAGKGRYTQKHSSSFLFQYKIKRNTERHCFLSSEIHDNNPIYLIFLDVSKSN